MATAIVHLYPFELSGWHGGTMRLRTALEASAQVGEPVLYWFDRARMRWIREYDLGAVGQRRASAASIGQEPSSPIARLKRTVFPSTLYESGRLPARAFDCKLVPPEATAVLHTSYLTPLVNGLRRAGNRRVVVDVHDMVAGAHADDARHGKAVVRGLRRAYALAVRHRERRGLSWAHGLAVAGWGDTCELRSLGVSPTAWAPVGIDAVTVPPASPRSAIRIGFIGNFAHSATIGAAKALLGSRLGASDGCRLVFAGAHSASLHTEHRAEVMGEVDDIRDFYSSIDAVVVPVRNASGMKCKLAEAVLARRVVITTPEGAAGYPTQLSRHFVVCTLDALTPNLVQNALSRDGLDEAYEDFEAACGRASAARAYARVIEMVMSTSQGGTGSAPRQARARRP